MSLQDPEKARLQSVMAAVTAEMIAEMGPPATSQDINRGNCEEWAEEVRRRFGKGESLWLESLLPEDPHTPAHCVFRFQELYYDAVYPAGEAIEAFLNPVPPPNESAYLPVKVWWDNAWKAYFDPDGEKIASSREVPAAFSLPPPNSWRIEAFKGLHGREIAQLRTVSVSALELSEADWSDPNWPNYEGRKDDAGRYAEWLGEGRKPPPIEVVETDGLRFRVTDGHRRLAAHKLRGLTAVQAWVSPIMEHPEQLRGSDGKVLMVGMTYEAMMARMTRTNEWLLAPDPEPEMAGVGVRP